MVKIELPLSQITSIPLVCDSPHSGTAYPDDFNFAVDFADLRRCEDTHIEKLWSAVPQMGGTLIHALFPRSYIDTNRIEFDIDVDMIDSEWIGRTEPSKRCLELGNGLIFSKTTTLQPIYDRKLGVAEIRNRIRTCWLPYRTALSDALARAYRNHGKYWHLNLHSMPSNAYERLGLPKGKVLADVVLGDLCGAACTAEFTAFVAASFKQFGYTVSINDPYAGMDLIAKHGNPKLSKQSLQIELNRALYLDENTREPLSYFEKIQTDMQRILTDIAAYIQHQP
jgi:N-formylglutamate deformylase